MYRKDLITAEIEKLAQVLAKIMGLKIELKLDEADQLLSETLMNSFALPIATLYSADGSTFEKWLADINLPAEKLDMLSQFIFDQLDAQNENGSNKILSQNLSLIYQTLANKHHIVHLAHLDRSKIIKQYLF